MNKMLVTDPYTSETARFLVFHHIFIHYRLNEDQITEKNNWEITNNEKIHLFKL